jgi:hypothetical protein
VTPGRAVTPGPAVKQRPGRPPGPAAKRGRVWLLGPILAGVVEVALYRTYQAHEARFHWFTHFFVGGTVGLIGMTVWIVEEKRPVRLPALWVVLGHLVAMFPDFLFRLGIPHRRWMDVFLGHISTPVVPGRNGTWYAVFLVALAGYLAADARLRARRSAGSGGRRRRH